MLSRTVSSTRVISRNLWSQRRLLTILNNRNSLARSLQNSYLEGYSNTGGRNDIRSYSTWKNDRKDDGDPKYSGGDEAKPPVEAASQADDSKNEINLVHNNVGEKVKPAVEDSSPQNGGKADVDTKSGVDKAKLAVETSSEMDNSRRKNEDDPKNSVEYETKTAVKGAKELANRTRTLPLSTKADDEPKGIEGEKPSLTMPAAETVAKRSPPPPTIPEEWPQVPVIALARNPVFPSFFKKIEVTDPQLMDILRKKVKIGQPFVGLFLKRDENCTKEVAATTEELHDVGTFCHIEELEDLGDRLRLTVKAHRRIRISTTTDAPRVVKESSNAPLSFTHAPVLIAETENCKHAPFTTENNIRVKLKHYALREEIVKGFMALCKVNKLYGDKASSMIMQKKWTISDLEQICDLGAAISASENRHFQCVLQEMDITRRLRMTLALLENELKVNKARQEKEENCELKMIKRELGIETGEKVTIEEKFRARLKDRVVPQQVQDVIEEEMEKLRSFGDHSQEFVVTSKYVDWLTNLPWGCVSKEIPDLKLAEEILNEDHYGMDDVKNRILQFIAASKVRGSTQGKILCFYGPPGVGKTSIAKSVAKALNREYFQFSVGGLKDAAIIKGHRRAYNGALPGRLIHCLKETKTENPLVLIDEVDKMARHNTNGDPASALLEVLDSEQNAKFLDDYLDIPVDLSKVLFICTANDPSDIPEPLKDRMEMIEVPGYVLEEKLAQKYLIPQLVKSSGLEERNVQINESALVSLINSYCREAGVRNLKKYIEKILRTAALKIVQEGATEVVISANNIESFVGKRVYNDDRIHDVTPPGVAILLAWDAMDGATHFIETSLWRPNSNNKDDQGSLGVIGQLGNVMKESCQIAYTYARGFLSNLDESNKFLLNSHIHLHVPEGAIRKEGPSAGCAIVTALLSIATGKPVKPNTAMTGEVALTGKILPVGGIKEKIRAAKRANVTNLVLPKANKKDFDDLPAYIKDGLKVVFVSDYKEVYDFVFET